MAHDYIVVPVASAQLARCMFGMLYAARNSYTWPMPGPTNFIWDPEPNVAGDLVAFGPLESMGPPDEDFGSWCLGKSLVTEIGTLTLPTESQSLDRLWFLRPPGDAPPEDPPEDPDPPSDPPPPEDPPVDPPPEDPPADPPPNEPPPSEPPPG